MPISKIDAYCLDFYEDFIFLRRRNLDLHMLQHMQTHMYLCQSFYVNKVTNTIPHHDNVQAWLSWRTSSVSPTIKLMWYRMDEETFYPSIQYFSYCVQAAAERSDHVRTQQAPPYELLVSESGITHSRKNMWPRKIELNISALIPSWKLYLLIWL
jgi:hypothetical protein